MRSMRDLIKLPRLGFVALIVGTALVGLFAVTPAQALNSEVFQLTSDHCTGGCLGGASSAGTVTVTEIGTNKLEFVVQPFNGGLVVDTGFSGSIGFNLDPNQTITYSNVTAGFSPVGGNPVGAQTLTKWDGLTSFEYAVIRDVNGGGNGLPSLTFDITGTSLTLASLAQNPDGQFFAVDILSGFTGKTGLVDASSGTVVPEPTSLLLVGTALFGTGLVAKRRFSSRRRIAV